MQTGYVTMTYADITDPDKSRGFKPSASIEEGLGKFVEW